MVILLRTSMTEHTRTPFHTLRLQFLPLQVPQLPPGPPEGNVKEMTGTEKADAGAIRIFYQFPWAFCIQRSAGMQHFLAFISLLYPSSDVPGCLDQKIALDAYCPYTDPDHNMNGQFTVLIKTFVELPRRMHSYRSWRSRSSSLGWNRILSCS